MGDELVGRLTGPARTVRPPEPDREVQRRTGGTSPQEVKAAALALARPQAGLRWLDIGAGRGDLLRAVRDRWEPARLVAVDIIDWLDDDLRGSVESVVGDAVFECAALAPADRVLVIEMLGHVDAPWTLLRSAARLVAPGGTLVLSTPNVATLRHRLELLTRGQLTAFRPQEPQHLTPVLPHIAEAILRHEGLHAITHHYAGQDIVPLTGGGCGPRGWPGGPSSC